MDGPEKANFMVEAMKPVIQEIFSQHKQEPVREGIGNGYQVMLKKKIQHDQVNTPEQQVYAPVQEHQVDIGQRILPGIKFKMPEIA